MKVTVLVAVLTAALFPVACADNNANGDASSSRNAETQNTAASSSQPSKRVAFTEADLDGLERGLGKETEAVRAAQARASAATTAAERGAAMQATWETSTIPLGAEASNLSEARYREVRESVDRVFTILDFQGKLDGPLSIDLERADPDTKARLSRDAFADLPPESAAALQARMNRLVPIWSEYKTLTAVAG